MSSRDRGPQRDPDVRPPSTFLSKYFLRLLICIALITVGSILLSAKPVGLPEQIFGGAAIGLAALSGALLAIDGFNIKWTFITPGADQCEG